MRTSVAIGVLLDGKVALGERKSMVGGGRIDREERKTKN